MLRCSEKKAERGSPSSTRFCPTRPFCEESPRAYYYYVRRIYMIARSFHVDVGKKSRASASGNSLRRSCCCC